MGKINSPLTSTILILLALSFVVSCLKPQIQKTQTTGVYHLVKKDETVQMIAQAYSVRLQDLAETNNITDVNSVKTGSVLFIPSANQVIDDVAANVKTRDTAVKVKSRKDGSDHVKYPAKNKEAKEIKTVNGAPAVTGGKENMPAAQDQKTSHLIITVNEENGKAKTLPDKKYPDQKIDSKPGAQNPVEKMPVDKKRFIWPVRGNVKENFGIQPNKTYNNWIKIVSTTGIKVKAAAAGTVIFSSKLKNYGETVIIRHKDNYATVYTHLKKRYVRIDQSVKRGEAIALLGEKDETGEAYINFEIRLQGKARNPLLFLP